MYFKKKEVFKNKVPNMLSNDSKNAITKKFYS